MLCANCKAVLQEDAVFCHKCGQRVVVETQDAGNWQLSHYVDSFQQPTAEWYITTKEMIQGTGAPMAFTFNLTIGVQCVIDQKNIWFCFYQMGIPAEHYLPYSNTLYNIEVLTGNGHKSAFIGQIENDGRIYLKNKDAFLAMLMNEEAPFKIHVSSNNNMNISQSSYLFEIDPHGFKNIYIQ